jgi:hypothetical protein
MTPDHISALTAIAAILEKVGTWPIGSILILIVLCPWLALLVVSRAMDRRFAVFEKNHASVIAMYESNVRLVEKYERISNEHVDTIRLSTSATVELVQFLRGRVPCFQRIQERTIRE